MIGCSVWMRWMAAGQQTWVSVKSVQVEICRERRGKTMTEREKQRWATRMTHLSTRTCMTCMHTCIPCGNQHADFGMDDTYMHMYISISMLHMDMDILLCMCMRMGQMERVVRGGALGCALGSSQLCALGRCWPLSPRALELARPPEDGGVEHEHANHGDEGKGRPEALDTLQLAACDQVDQRWQLQQDGQREQRR